MLPSLPNQANESCGWAGQFPVFQAASIEEIVQVLMSYIRDATPAQQRAWQASLAPLQRQCGEFLVERSGANRYCAILEFQMPESTKRVDAVLLLAGAVLVVELKGDGNWQPEYREQVADYARRLSWFHRYCGEEHNHVHAVLANYGIGGSAEEQDFLTTTRVEQLAAIMRRFDRPATAQPIELEQFLSRDACQPSPSLVQAVRKFFSKNALPRLKRIDEITGKTVARVIAEIRQTHADRRRKLILVSGVPGAGKTYVGLQIAHDSFLDDLAEPTTDGEKPTAPAVFLSGNGPLVEVLQYELKNAGGGGRVFVRGVKDFIKKFSAKRSGAPPHHVLIFDEAQRAWDATKVRAKHGDPQAPSEPASFVAFAERVPGWCVIIGLIGSGQEIHSGEEGGIALWAEAVAGSRQPWDVVGAEPFRAAFAAHRIAYTSTADLHLARSVRFHFAAGLSQWAANLVDDTPSALGLFELARHLIEAGYQLRVTRNLPRAREFLWKKYEELPEARFGLLCSSRDKRIGETIDAPLSGKFFRAGPWYADPQSSPSSCRRLQDAITEFAAQGLELDHTLVVWGSDFVLKEGRWNNAEAKRYQRASNVRDALQLRRNAYRVLLTRGREGVIFCLPPHLRELDETFDFLKASGCEPMDANP